jgi:hypothetical protein
LDEKSSLSITAGIAVPENGLVEIREGYGEGNGQEGIKIL